jgi:hypothetical protein
MTVPPLPCPQVLDLLSPDAPAPADIVAASGTVDLDLRMLRYVSALGAAGAYHTVATMLSVVLREPRDPLVTAVVDTVVAEIVDRLRRTPNFTWADQILHHPPPDDAEPE